MNMTTRTRVAITVTSAVALAAAKYGETWSALEPDPARHIWGLALLASYGLAIVAVALVDRWWALLPVFAPVATDIYIQNFTDYVYPWQSESIHPGWAVSVVLLVLWIGLPAAVLSIGFLPRRVWSVGRRLHLSKTTPKGAGR
ncbi:MAG: hypothetical protein ACRDPE_14375 [Solirubrobacterales bacterium]